MREQLKQDIFGTVSLERMPGDAARVVRDVSSARWWVRPLARSLANREARALHRLDGLAHVPRLLGRVGAELHREWIDGEPMQRSRPHDPAYFRAAMHLVRQLHARDVVHNDLAKEPNWLVTPRGEPALVDFQLAWHSPRRSRLFRSLAHDDLRHLLKHKRTYVPERLTARERRILQRRSWVARAWLHTGKPLYRWITRGLLGWSDREGAGDRNV